MSVAKTSLVTLEFRIGWDEGEPGVDEPYPIFELESISPRGVFSNSEGTIVEAGTLICPKCTGKYDADDMCLCDADSVAEGIANIGCYSFLEECLPANVFKACVEVSVPKKLRITGHAIYDWLELDLECDERFEVRSYELTDI